MKPTPMFTRSLLLLAVVVSAPSLPAQAGLLKPKAAAPRSVERTQTDKPGWLGVYLEDVDDQVQVTEVVPGSPALKAGLRAGDRIVSIDGEACGSTEEVVKKIGSRKVGAEVKLVLMRDQKTERVTVKLGARPEPEAAGPMAIEDAPKRSGGAPAKLPAKPPAEPMAPAQGSGHGYLGIGISEEETGLEITSVVPEGPAAGAGARVGDRIVRAGDHKLGDLASLEKVMQKTRPGQKLELLVQRGEKELELQVTLGRRTDSGGVALPKASDQGAAEKAEKTEKAEKVVKDKNEADKAAKAAKEKEKAARAEQDKAAKEKAKVEKESGKAKVKAEAELEKSRSTKSQKGAVVWGKDLKQALETAKASGKPVLVKFQAEWCQPCHLLSEVLARPEVQSRLSGFVTVIVDTDEDARATDPLADKYGVTGLPHVVAMDSSGKQLGSFTGNQTAEFVQKWLGQWSKTSAGGGGVARSKVPQEQEGEAAEARRAAERAHAEAKRHDDEAHREAERAHTEAKRHADEARASGAQPRPANLDAEVRELREELRNLREILEKLMEKMDRR